MNEQPTLTVWFTPRQITVAQHALRAEVRRRTRSIEKAEEARRAGARVQHGVLDSHYRERDEARALLESLELARKQYAQRVADRIALGSGRDD